MAGEITVDLAECLQMLYREETSSCKSSVHNGRAVSLGQYQTVPVLLVRILRINVHFLEIKDRDDLSH